MHTETSPRIDHILGHKSSLGKFKKIEIIPSIFSDHNAVRLDLNYRRKTIKNSNIWRLNNTLLNNQQITEQIKKEIQSLNDTIDQVDLTDIYRTFHHKTMNFTFFSSAHGTFSKIDHILDHKSSLVSTK